MMRRLAPVIVAALVCTAPGLRADEVLGRKLTRQAQQALEQGNPERALELIQQARIEWPGSPVVAHTLADARYRQGDYAGALLEYDKGSGGAHAFRAFFNQGVTLNARGEQGLTEAGVPLDPAGIPADVDPGPMLQAIDAALPDLESARGRFLESLDEQSDTSARESVASLNKRMDDLREMKEILEEMQEEQEDQESEDQEEGDEQSEDEQEDGEQDDEGEQDEQQEGDQPQDQDQDQEPQEGEPDQQQDQQGEQDQQEPTDPQDVPPMEGQQTQLTPQEMQSLLEQLEELEERAQALQRIRRAQQRKGVEKDW